VKTVLPRLHGAFGLLFLFENQPDLLVCARRGSPLAIGHGDGENYVGSDALSVSHLTDMITYLEEGDWAVLRSGSFQVFAENNAPVVRPAIRTFNSATVAEKGNYRHFMNKEIHEQPEVVSHTLSHYLDFSEKTIRNIEGLDFAGVSSMTLSACGSAYIAGMVGRYWFEELARMPVDMDVASEFRYREPPLPQNGMSMFISQSGETADTLATLRFCKSQQQKIVSVVNVSGSTIARESDIALPTMAGPEISVASTKGFTCQLAVMAALSIVAGVQRKTLSEERAAELISALASVPRLMLNALQADKQMERLGKELSKFSNVLYIGRGRSFPLALEGALKLKEISYIHAEGYPAGELKHGPIALLDEDMPVIVIAPYDHLFEKTMSNMQEVVARGSKVILFTDAKGASETNIETLETVIMPDCDPFVAPLIYSIPLQQVSYHTALFKGTDVDQPRNLAKSVTVE
jgi:glucosamine--fructose-6-phosphate aminotransferase (isomerizing)